MDGNGQMDFGFNGCNGKHGDDGKEGKKRKKRGMESVSRHNAHWQADSVFALHMHIVPGWRGQPEDWRPLITSLFGPPTSPHAWGPLTSAVIRDGTIRATGRRIPMRSKKSNARKTDEYERPIR